VLYGFRCCQFGAMIICWQCVVLIMVFYCLVVSFNYEVLFIVNFVLTSNYEVLHFGFLFAA
jgi:hypothetical protein